MSIMYYLLSFLLGGIVGSPIILYYGYKMLEIVLRKEEEMESKPDLLDDLSSELDPGLVTRVGWINLLHEEKELVNQNLTGMLSSSISSLLERRNNPIPKRDKHACYAVLKKEKLMIYESGNRIECRGVILLTEYEVCIYPQDLADNEVYKKQYPIHLKYAKEELDNENKFEEYFIYLESSVEKESWFIDLLKASKMDKSNKEKEALNLDKTAIQSLMDTLDSSNVHLQTKWLNALLGRIFLGIYKTEAVKQYFIHKIKTKTTKVKKPGFLGEILVRDLKVGDSIPYITNPKLLNLSQQGELTLEMDLSYNGGFLAEIETIANLQVTTKLKPIKINLLLTVKLKHLSGKILLRIKPAPTNRFWIGFYSLPKIELEIEPTVSDTQIKSNMIISAIEKRILDQIKDSLVLPNMDDYCFFPSNGSGGIFDIINNFNEEEDQMEEEKSNEDVKQEEVIITEDKDKINEEEIVINNNSNISPTKILNLKDKLQMAINGHYHSHEEKEKEKEKEVQSSSPSRSNSTGISERIKNFKESYFGKKKNTIFINDNLSMPELNDTSNSFDESIEDIQLPQKAQFNDDDGMRKRNALTSQQVKVAHHASLS